MEYINTIASYCGSISAIIALVILIVKPIRTKFVELITKTSGKDDINTKIDTLTELVQKQVEQNEIINTELQKQSMALQATLRNSILDIYNENIEKGYMTMYGKQNLAELFKQYEALGGNCFVHDCVFELNNLPIKSD